jgi:hypothetical protein
MTEAEASVIIGQEGPAETLGLRCLIESEI